jgi:hypothetical protein
MVEVERLVIIGELVMRNPSIAKDLSARLARPSYVLSALVIAGVMVFTDHDTLGKLSGAPAQLFFCAAAVTRRNSHITHV